VKSAKTTMEQYRTLNKMHCILYTKKWR